MKRTLLVLTLCFGIFAFFLSCKPEPSTNETAWPDIGQESRPWTRWWWHGSSVSKEGITAELETLAEAGIGGLEITPIYGVKGEEEAFIPYLSPKWLDMLEYTLQEAKRLGLGIDMATGTGWPFGGPWVSEEDASKYLVHRFYKLEEGDRLSDPVQYMQESFVRQVYNQGIKAQDLQQPIAANANLQQLAIDQVRFEKSLPLISLMAYSSYGDIVDLKDKLSPDGQLDWVAPKGVWSLYAVFQGWHGKMVERAAPGGEGYVIDHFSKDAIQHYLARFDSAFEGRDLGHLRAFFNDSYEVDDARGQANWTPDLLAEFEARRGYDLQLYWRALFGNMKEDTNNRVLSDFRETISELILETFTQEWNNWAHETGKIVRNQSHGSPANILDLYAASDIPETEGTDLIRIKFATSAGHVSGKQLISSEAATWLDEHFQSNLADWKENLDRYLVGGVNHVFYHGTCYSPPDAEWPGRLFYAAIHANPRNSLWHDFAALNQYMARTQSFLQQGVPHNDILLYFPAYDRYATPTRELLDHFDGHGPSLEGTTFELVARQLLTEGFAYDYVSDKQLQQLIFENGGIQTGGTKYQTILLPKCTYILPETFGALVTLAENGATILFHEALPISVPGLGRIPEQRNELQELVSLLNFQSANGVEEAKIGKGRFLLGNDIATLLQLANVERETLVDQGLAYTRRWYQEGQVCYFLTNWSSESLDGWVPLSTEATAMVLLDPMTGEKGQAKVRQSQDGGKEVYLQLAQGSSCLLLSSSSDASPAWQYYEPAGNAMEWRSNWQLEFLEGGPELPESVWMDTPMLWTSLEGESYQRFSGTARYTSEFSIPEGEADAWLIDLGKVHESASILLNGEKVATSLGPTYQIILPKEKLKENNTLGIEVSNLMANRIAWMDRNGENWKHFYNINFPPRKRENRGKDGLFDASSWEAQPSGLEGTLAIQPLVYQE